MAKGGGQLTFNKLYQEGLQLVFVDCTTADSSRSEAQARRRSCARDIREQTTTEVAAKSGQGRDPEGALGRQLVQQ